MEQHGPHVSIKAETLFYIGPLPVTNSLLSAWVLVAVMVVLAYLYFKKNKTIVSLYTWLFRGLYTTFQPIFGDDVKKYFKYVASFFLFILLGNWMGLIPGVNSIGIYKETEEGIKLVPILRGATADLNMTFALAIFAIVLVQYLGIQALGARVYLSKFFNFSSPINFAIGILEIISELSRALSLSFRLFGNVFAGEVLLAVVAFLVPILASLPFLMFEVFVGFIQAVVFSMLLAIFISVAVKKPHHA